MVVDCRSLIEFCRAFEHHRRSGNSSASNGRRNKSLNPFSHPFCEHSPFAAIDIIILLLGLGALGILAFSYIELIFNEACDLLPETFDVIGDVIHNAPLAYAAGFVLMFAAAIVAWELIDQRSRKCGNPHCQGLRKAVEFDIQLESEECVKYLPVVEEKVFGSQPPELGQDHKELEAELKKMAPLNGRTVLVFRKRCGCPIGRMEVWGAKKVRRIKK